MLVLLAESESVSARLRCFIDDIANHIERAISYDAFVSHSSILSHEHDEADFNAKICEVDVLHARLACTEVILFGHAGGGVLAQEYALRYSSHLIGLILCNTTLAVADLNEPIDSTFGRLGKIALPVLIIGGRHDTTTPPVEAERLHAALPNSRRLIFDKSGHFPFDSEPEKFVVVIATWIDDIVPPHNELTSPERN